MKKFWILLHRDKLVLSWGTLRFLRRVTISPKFSLGPINGPAVYNNIDDAREAARVIVDESGDPCYVMELVTVEKVEPSEPS